MNNETPKERGLITYFDIEQFGFYRLRQKKVGEPLDIDTDDLLLRLSDWLTGKQFQNTVPWGGTQSSFNKIYCTSFYLEPTTGDMVLVLYKSVGAENGGVKGIKFNSPVDTDSNDTVASKDGVKANEVAWGQVMYYWFIPSENKLASIKFSDSVCDINGLSQYVREWVKYRCNKHVGKEFETVRVSPDGNKRVVVTRKMYQHKDGYTFCFKFIAKQFRRKTGVHNLGSVFKKVTHLVFRSTVNVVTTDRRGFAKLLDKYLPVFSFSAPDKSDDNGGIPDSKEYEVIVNSDPTNEELEEIFRLYNEEYDETSTWDNVGLKINGRSNDTLWLDQYVVKDEIHMSKKEAHKDVYSARQIMQQILINRPKYLKSIKEEKATEDTPSNSSSQDNSMLAEESNA
ncbi:hypothetical protein TUMSATVNIG1_07720 [Vibrio nigripulchritudo]|uniref:hypothetical protein n=1 Tax=Vibrio nigripulchritudo TaxID=28173 RepID=UPI00190BAE90|nr:hypothetical protein [Vibrio nigripulchritudo]BCL68832.1 hypothetical protein VNTUMSATTG_07690 [Vibrio nigripulchritudo]BDU30163.1 hypothetical protein TUMSATVNIG1_07720 [Vibrio nigripulchritudo]